MAAKTPVLPPRQFVGIREAAAHLSVTERTIRRWMASGQLPGYWVGSHLRVDVNDLKTFVRPVAPGEVSA